MCALMLLEEGFFSEQSKPLPTFSCVMLYSATLSFLYVSMLFCQRSVIPSPVRSGEDGLGVCLSVGYL